MYLLDTDTLVYSLKGNEDLRRNLESHLNDTMKLCVITLMELYFGAYKSERVAWNLARVRTLQNSFPVIAVEQEIAETFGMLKASLGRSGQPLDDFDLIIASCALAHNLTLVTNNVKHFKRITDLRITNWCVFPEKESP